MLASASPWAALRGPAAPSMANYALYISLGILLPLIFVWLYLVRRHFRKWPASVIALLVIAQAVLIEGAFAQLYYMLSAQSPHSFDHPLTSIDAAYFTISTATTTGMGDIHPVSGTARLLVSAQMVASVFLVVIAITTAVQRVLARDGSHQ
jgi:Ion channel